MSRDQKFPVVGVGASAGGIEALEGFFQGLPDNPGAAFVVVMHLNPDRQSYLAEILARYTGMRVSVASDGQTFEPDNVYIAPPASVVRVRNAKLELVERRGGARDYKPIDIFLTSLANAFGERAISVILSGADGDGALGTKAVKEAGGITFAQVADGHGPSNPAMPDTAIQTGLVDLAIPVEQMGGKIVELVRDSEKANDEESQAADKVYDEICTILRRQTGHDFGGYKKGTFVRRVHRRRQIAQLNTLEDYLAMLRQNPTEAQNLFRDLLISVTNFFRDPDAFVSLEANVIPKLFENRGADQTIRIWVPACATGEEVYSIAILMREHMASRTTVPRVQIFATDIDDRALAVARAARYPKEALANVSQERRRFFIEDSGSYVVGKDLRELCIFSSHNLIRDPPFSHMDLVSCRNLLIYFGAGVQNEIIPIFHYSLHPDGYLFLGASENVSQFTEFFTPIDRMYRIFKSRDDVPTRHLRVLYNNPSGRAGREDAPPGNATRASSTLRHAVESQVLQKLAPPHVVVNREGEILYYSANTGKYLEAPVGIPTRQLTAIARRDLRLDLSTAFREALQSGRRSTRRHVDVSGDDGRVQRISVSAEPLSSRDRDTPLYLIAFNDEGPSLSEDEWASRAELREEGSASLEIELREMRERLQSQAEEYETAIEELRSSNEELISLNEEMQSTNEELEATKEEMQSLNEELSTVNAELLTKVDALDRANSDLQNLFESSQIATVFLDQNLTIRTFTPAISRFFKIVQTDRGRPLSDLSGRVAWDVIASDIESVASNGKYLERQLTDKNGTQILMRLNPYRNSNGQLDGAIVTFVELTPSAETRPGSEGGTKRKPS